MRELRNLRQRLQRPPQRWYGLLGDEDGVVEVEGRTGYYYARVRQAGSSNYAVGQFRARGALQLYYNLPIIIESDLLTDEQLIIGTDGLTLAYGEAGGDYDIPSATLDPHNDQHEFGGADQLDWLDTRQLYALRVQPTGNAEEVHLQAGVYIAGSAFYLRPEAETLDLSSYAPASGTTWLLIALDTEGAVSITDVGNIYAEAHGAAYRVATAQTNTKPVALVQVGSGDTPGWSEIVDLRFASEGDGSATAYSGAVTEYVDQSNVALAEATALTGEHLYQSFQVSQAGEITRVALYISRVLALPSGETLPQVALYAGDDGTGTLLAEGTAQAMPATSGSESVARSASPDGATLLAGTGRDLVVYLILNGGAVTSEEAVRTWSISSPEEQSHTIGGATDLWGETWEDTDLFGTFMVMVGEAEPTSNTQPFHGFDLYGVSALSGATILGIEVSLTTAWTILEGGGGDPYRWHVDDVAVTVHYRREGGVAQWVEFAFSAPVAVESETDYTLLLQGENAVKATGDLYADGEAGRDTSTALATRDLLFKVWLLTGDNPFVSIGPGGIYIRYGNISLSDGGLVDGVDVSALYAQVTALTANDSAQLFAQVVDVTVANTTTATSLLGAGRGAKSVAADTLDVGSVIRVTLRGYVSNTSTPTLALVVSLGGSTVASTGTQTTESGLSEAGWQLTVELTCRSTGASGSVIASGLFECGAAQWGCVKTTATTVDTTAALAVGVTATWGTAHADNEIVCQAATIELVRADALAVAAPSGLTTV